MQVFGDYENMLDRVVSAIGPLLDSPPISLKSLVQSSLKDKWDSLPAVRALFASGR